MLPRLRDQERREEAWLRRGGCPALPVGLVNFRRVSLGVPSAANRYHPRGRGEKNPSLTERQSGILPKIGLPSTGLGNHSSFCSWPTVRDRFRSSLSIIAFLMHFLSY